MKILILDIPGHPGFKASTDGTIYGKRGNPLKPRLHQGYLKVRVTEGWVSLHRLLALTFISNPNLLDTVNHKDGNKLNNSLDNLEWCSRQENLYHAMENDLHPWGRTPIVDSDGNVYVSQAQAAKINKINQANINRAIKTGGTYYKKKWKYYHECVNS